jgi:hypothetical protein
MSVQEVEGAPSLTFCSKIVSIDCFGAITEFLKYEKVDFSGLDTVEKVEAFIREAHHWRRQR